ncbi:MAG: glycosyltransferase family 2 protein, partial [Victivallales bacterium]|nr:glycosyltransferase family 2 protein [Victivallales bacterium]
ISVIMPVYNRQHQMMRSIRSVLQQDFTEFELIIVDDASTDATVEVVRAEMQNDPRIHLVCLETNSGPGPARNAGIAQARGTYIRTCDSDDFYPPGALSAMARRVEHEDFDVVAGNWCYWYALRRFAKIDTGNSLITEDRSSSDLRELSPLWSLLHFSRCMFRRDFLLENGIEYPAMRRAEDPVYMARILSKAKRFALIQDVVFLFHQRPRNQIFSFEEVHNAFSAYQSISEELIGAGFRELAFVFHGFFSSLQFEYDIYTDEEALELAVLLKKSLKNVELSELDNPVFEQCGFDLLKLHHDYWVVKTFSADELARLMKQGVLCGMAGIKKHHIRRLTRENRELLQKLSRLEPLLRIKRGIARRLSKFRRQLKRWWRRRRLK